MQSWQPEGMRTPNEGGLSTTNPSFATTQIGSSVLDNLEFAVSYGAAGVVVVGEELVADVGAPQVHTVRGVISVIAGKHVR